MSDLIEPVDDAAAEVPEPVVTPEPDPPPEHHEDHDDRPGWVDEILNKIDTVKEASPITPVEEDVLDKSPVRPPWTHRGLFRKG
jgi:hypothetical protein